MSKYKLNKLTCRVKGELWFSALLAKQDNAGHVDTTVNET